jgi:hypothetical protein
VQQVLDEQRRGTKMIMQVHDELVFEVPETEVDWLRTEIPRLMAGVASAQGAAAGRGGRGPTGTRRTDLTVGEVTINVGGFKMPAYRAAPAGKTNLPVVLVLSGDLRRARVHRRHRAALCPGRLPGHRPRAVVAPG